MTTELISKLKEGAALFCVFSSLTHTAVVQIKNVSKSQFGVILSESSRWRENVSSQFLPLPESYVTENFTLELLHCSPRLLGAFSTMHFLLGLVTSLPSYLCQGKHTDRNQPPWPGTIVTVCVSYFTTGGPGKE